MNKNLLSPEFVFETCWEVCNKVGGIHTVITSKYKQQHDLLDDQVIFIGPDIQYHSHDNGEFIEDESFFSAWKHKIKREGLRVRTGRWNIEGNPFVILVEFTNFISEKDKILSKLWEDFGVDSLRGGWEYVESILFGYAAGKVIESFSNFHLNTKKRIVAHFHEWMTAAGVLYLQKNTPQIVTLFTTHATCLGRSICSNGQKLYKQLSALNVDEKVRELGIVSKHSIEKQAAQYADCFTTVSEITAHECGIILEKTPDIVCPNGFNLPDSENVSNLMKTARARLLKIVKAMTGNVSEEAMLIVTSGRYEYRNKGIDLFLSSLKQLSGHQELKHEIVAFIMVPSHHYGARPELQNKLNRSGNNFLDERFTTHNLHNFQEDTIMRTIRYYNFSNNKNDKVKIIFAPVYLNGDDGIFNMKYYDLLPGFDIGVFPSYYEPWGYTPHESIAMKVPTITSSLSGFGKWAEHYSKSLEEGILVIDRNDENYSQAAHEMTNALIEWNVEKLKKGRDNAQSIAKKATWDVFFENYKDAYSLALEKIEERKAKITEKKQIESIIVKENIVNNSPVWKKMIIQSNLPENLKKLDELSYNLWWSWNYEAIELFEEIDSKAWIKCKKNPVALLKAVSIDRFNELEADKVYTEKVERVYKEFKDYMAVEPPSEAPEIAYFSMEYGMTDVIKIFSGGLGILAGDYLKEASDSNVKMTGVGFLYRYGYFSQRLSVQGDQLVDLVPQVFSELPIKMLRDKAGVPFRININLPGRVVKSRIWEACVGRIKLYLLDTDSSQNSDEDKTITHQLYGGNWENRLKQELLLGLGGIQLLEKLDIHPDIYHCNEGHAAFMNLQRLTDLIERESLSFDEALEIVRASSLFTTHTPVPAGHDAFDEDLVRSYLRHVPEQLKISWDTFIGLGRYNIQNQHEKFSMSVFAAKTSQELNGVSKLHGHVTREMFTDLWKGYAASELHIGHVTNGVHYGTWTVPEWRKLHTKAFGKEYIHNLSKQDYWRKISEVPDEEVWNIRNKLRKKLIDYIKERFEISWIRRHENPKTIVEVLNKINDKSLTIGFARRFATYKRAHLLFNDIERLSQLVNNKEKPVQFIFAGKAHPHDKAGQDLIKHIVEISRRKKFIGKILFLENYDMELARKLVSGVDVWFNTPTRPLEASGTSGEKAIMNGVLNFSVLDGWWVEGYKENAGWALSETRTYENQDFQNQLDTATIYSVFENEIIPAFYQRNNNNIPSEWIKYIKKSFSEIAPEFNTKRMMDDYRNRFYQVLFDRTKKLKKDNYRLTFEISEWKRKIQRGWKNIEVVKVHFPSTSRTEYKVGETYSGTVVLDLKELQDENIGVEMVFADKRKFKKEIVSSRELVVIKKEESRVFYKIDFKLKKPGVYDWGLRIYPKNENLPHRQDFPYLRWI